MTNITIAVNSANNTYVDNNGNLAMATGINAVNQDCASAMKAQRGEMIYEPENGMPTFEDVWIGQNLKKWEAAGRSALAFVNGVVRVESFTINTTSSPGSLNYTALILTVYSDTLQTITGVL